MTDLRMQANVFTIPASQCFVDSLARGLLEHYGREPFDLAALTVLLPTRRAVRALREAFLRQTGGRPLLLPSMWPLGDIDEAELALGAFSASADLDLPPEIEPLRRQLLLAQLVEKARPDLSPAQAAELAAELTRFLDQLQMAGLSLNALSDLAPEDHAMHWRQTLEFLDILGAPWQTVLAAEAVLEPVERRARIVGDLIRQWRAAAPAGPVVAAGSSGSVETTAQILELVARLPRGMVLLPGLDRQLDEESWLALREDHPQFAMRGLLQRLRLRRDEVATWPTADGGLSWREKLLSAALRPAETTDQWRRLGRFEAAATDGMERLDCKDEQEEALAIALAMRQVLETPDKTAALVTTDRGLGQRVAAELKRWGIEVDNSAGSPLGNTTAGGFLRLLAEALAPHTSPHLLLALLKHPLARAGQTAARFRGLVRTWELNALRGPRPAPGLDGVARALRAAGGAVGEALDLFLILAAEARALETSLAGGSAALRDLLRQHLGLAEWLSRDENGDCRLWDGDDGDAAAAFVNQLDQAAAGLPALAGPAYPALFAALMANQTVRPRYGRHPRLNIWGPLEARLQRADLMILGGLNETVWPALPRGDPWLSRPMREQLALPAAEWRIGMSAHDFVQAASAPNVILTRAERGAGAPTVPSRWLLRLDQILKATGLALPTARTAPLRHWCDRIDRPGAVKPAAAPEPKPPIEARPRSLSATRIQTWMQNPYGLYAAHILRLRPLDEIDADPTFADRGIAIHKAVEWFIDGYQDRPPELALSALLDFGRAAFGEFLERPAVQAFWWPRFERIAQWLVAEERLWQAEISESHVESSGRLEIAAPAGAFTLTAKADRLDLRRDGGIEIIDYKSGTLPSLSDVRNGEAPQLVLEALIAAAGGFESLPAAPIGGLSYWKLSGGREPGRVHHLNLPLDEVMADARDGLSRLVAAFDRPETPYRARPRPEVSLRYDDYEHLARIKEWSAGGPGDR